jgi:hypothetical protein
VFMADCSFKWLFESTSKRNINLDQGVSVFMPPPPLTFVAFSFGGAGLRFCSPFVRVLRAKLGDVTIL